MLPNAQEATTGLILPRNVSNIVSMQMDLMMDHMLIIRLTFVSVYAQRNQFLRLVKMGLIRVLKPDIVPIILGLK